MRIAEEYRCNFYDACYLALAELLGLPFTAHPEESAAADVSKGADDKLEGQLAGRIPRMLRSPDRSRGSSKDALPLARLDLP